MGVSNECRCSPSVSAASPFRRSPEDLALRFRRWQQADASQPVAFHLRKLMRNILGRARDAGPVNRLGRNESLLARLHVSAMPVVDLSVPALNVGLMPA